MKSNLISKSETSKILEQIKSQWKIEIPKQKNIKTHDVNEKGIIITGNEITAVKIGDDILPFLDDIPILEKFPYVTVDMGAVKFVCKGANVMRPGIKKFSDFTVGDIVCVIEESQNKFLAVGIAQVASSELEDMKNGEILKNFHYISDRAWEISKTL